MRINFQGYLRKIRKFLSGPLLVPHHFVFSTQTLQYEKALVAVRLFYLFSVMNCLTVVFNAWPGLHKMALNHPLWIFQWFDWNNYKHQILDLSVYIYFFSSLFNLFQPKLRVVRTLTFISLLVFVGILNSDGHFSHYMHMMMYPTFAFIFLPKDFENAVKRIERAQVLVVFFMAQLSICVAYEMAGYSKITEIFHCIYDNGFEGCEVGSNIMTNMAALEEIQFRWPTFSGEFLYEFPAVGAILYYGIIWIHLVSIFIAFRPQLHRFFVFYRICFHFGTLALFGIGFTTNILAMLSVFAFSPFYYKASFLNTLSSLPPLQFLFKCKK